MEKGETIISAAKREMKEEAGYEIDVWKFEIYFSLDPPKFLTVFRSLECFILSILVMEGYDMIFL